MYAGFWKRAAAYLIDYVLVAILTYVIFFCMGLAMAPLLQSQSDQMPAWAGILLILVIVGFLLLYYVYAESSPWQATIGKRIMGIKVTDEQGRRISFWRSLGRRAAMIISYSMFLIGYLMCIWTERKQCLHDKIAGCLVVNKNYVPGQQDAAPRKTPVWAILLCCVPVGILVMGMLSASVTSSMTEDVEESRADMVVKAMQLILEAKKIQRIETGQDTTDWENILNQPIVRMPEIEYLYGSQEFNPNDRSERERNKKWVLVLGPKEMTAWRTGVWKYRIVMPYETRVPKCRTEEAKLQSFCEKFNMSWKGNSLRR